MHRRLLNGTSVSALPADTIAFCAYLVASLSGSYALLHSSLTADVTGTNGHYNIIM